MSGAGQDNLKMWQKYVIGEISKEQFDQWLKNCTQPFTELDKTVKNIGVEKTLKLKYLEIGDINDSELKKLIGLYNTHKNLIIHYLEVMSKREMDANN